jgi:hypothetical protein
MGKTLLPNPAAQGDSVALSGDGLTALIGAPGDLGGDPGGAYVFTLNNGTWKEQTRMAGGGSIGTLIYQGGAVAISGDGNVAAVGGRGDNSSVGAVWVFTRSNGAWTQGHKLVGSGSSEPLTRAFPSPCHPAATPPSLVPLGATTLSGPRGYLINQRIHTISTAIR